MFYPVLRSGGRRAVWRVPLLMPMVLVSIVGDRGSGKTTFLGLLYAAQVKSGSGKTDDFRFHAAFESLDEISGLFQRLMSGAFPDSATKEGMETMSFQLGYRKRRLGSLSLSRSRPWAPGAMAPFRFSVLRNLEEGVSRLLRGSALADGALRDALDCDALAILVDSRNLAVKGEDPRLTSIGKYDAAVESLLGEIQRWRRHGGRKLLFPIFIFSKFDGVASGALRAANVEAVPPEVAKRGRRGAYAEALLGHNLPRTLATVKGKERGGLQFAGPAYFFSWVRAKGEERGGGERLRLRQSPGAGWEPDYSKDEYIAFLACLLDIASRTPE